MLYGCCCTVRVNVDVSRYVACSVLLYFTFSVVKETVWKEQVHVVHLQRGKEGLTPYHHTFMSAPAFDSFHQTPL